MAIIMISRGTFSGGKALAEHVADRLGYPCLSKEEIVREAVEKYGISEKELTTAEMIIGNPIHTFRHH